MTKQKKVLRIATAVILDDEGRMLLVKKMGTKAFMQPGGKIEAGENALQSLRRELIEELCVGASDATFIARICAPAANEPGFEVDADVFRVVLSGQPSISAEIEEMCWWEDHPSLALNVAPLSKKIMMRISDVDT